MARSKNAKPMKIGIAAIEAKSDNASTEPPF